MTTSHDPIICKSMPKLGEELPVFCERCGYSLHGSPQVRCDHCAILQFHCPECGHHQPINTLRPAVQRVLGRARATWLAMVVFLKLNFFGWLLFGWVGMGASWSYQYGYSSRRPSTVTWNLRPVDSEAAICFILLGLLFGMVGRMLLLRWRKSGYVGMVLASLVSGAISFGIWIQFHDLRRSQSGLQSGFNSDMGALTAIAAATIIISSIIVWPIWNAMARAFLPRNASKALLDWQISQSDRSVSALARD
ncbi:MAG TPA: hypothetical protein VHD56_14140 [Tepidisphaeraceae bacterium]|nr:hypothetical protein [Tepidisphaeraceae bacterium]